MATPSLPIARKARLQRWGALVLSLGLSAGCQEFTARLAGAEPTTPAPAAAVRGKAPNDVEEIRALTGHTGRVGWLTFAPDGKTLASAGDDHTVRLWDLAAGKEIRCLNKHGAGWGVRSMVFAPDGKTLAVAEADGRNVVSLWDVVADKEIGSLAGHKQEVERVTFSPDGKTLASAGRDHTVRLWDVAAGKEVYCLEGQTSPSPVAFAPDGKTLVTVGQDQAIRFWDVGTGKEIRSLAGTGDVAYSVGALAFSPDGRTLASGGNDRTLNLCIRLWDAATGKEIRRIQDTRLCVTSLAFAPDGKTLASGIVDHTVQLWEVATGKEIRRKEFPVSGHLNSISSLAFAPDGKVLALGSQDVPLRLWDVRRFGRPRPAEAPGDRDLQKLWADLAGDDVPQAYQAIADLAGAPGAVVPFLEKQLVLPAAPDPKRLARLIADLDHRDFSVRQEAVEGLEKIGPAAEAALRDALTRGPSLEVRQRVDRLLEKATALTPERLRQLRAIQALEWAGTKEARQLLEHLSQQEHMFGLAREARAALDRLKSV